MDGADNLYIADSNYERVFRVDPSGIITTVAGTGPYGEYRFRGDGGPANEAQLNHPRGVAVDRTGNLYIADTHNGRIRRVDPAGIITTVAGVGLGNYSGGTGPAVEAVLHSPRDVAVDSAGNLYISDESRSVIRRVDTSGIITTVAGTGISGSSGDGGPANEAQLDSPRGVAVDNSGNVYIADTNNQRIRVLMLPPELPSAPTRLAATAVSFQEIELVWQDNSEDETGFRVQRRTEGTADWVDIGATAANATTFSDTGLAPLTTYRYRVRAFKKYALSGFSNHAAATTLEAFPPTLNGFSPTSGPVGTRVTLTGTHFLGVTAVAFNGVTATEFEVVSGTSIEAVVPRGASTGPISVVAPGGTVVSNEPFTVTIGFHSRLFVPIVLRSQGRTPGSFFTSELTLTNRGTTTAAIHYTYTAAFRGGSGTAVDSLEPGRQRIIPDAIAYLTSLGVPIGSGLAGGTLAVDFSNLSSPSAAAVTVRVATPVEEGRAGLAYPGVNPEGLLSGPAFITGLRQNSQDRSNVALQNAGDANDGSITLRVTVFSGNPEDPSLMLPERSLTPGEFYQYNGILNEAGFDNGYVKVERLGGTAPFYAYGVINDNFNSDGSFVFPVREDSLAGNKGQTLPVIVETGAFTSELILTSLLDSDKSVHFLFGADSAEADGDAPIIFAVNLKAGAQITWPNLVGSLRQPGAPDIGPADRPFMRALFAIGTGPPITGGISIGGTARDMSGIVIGARTGSPDKRGGQYSLFYSAVPDGSASVETAWIYGLQQNSENRSNLALVNTGEIDDSSSTFEITIYDGDGDTSPRTRSVTLDSRHWIQENGILGNIGQGYVQVRKVSGNNSFIAYGVINDGGRPGERSGDGAYLPARP